MVGKRDGKGKEVVKQIKRKQKEKRKTESKRVKKDGKNRKGGIRKEKFQET